jgi:predicted enzyme related to lactoylglutathione lyase
MSRVVHFEIPSSSPEKAVKFYQSVFGWTFNQFGNDGYWLATTGDEKSPGINGAVMQKRHPQQPLTNSIDVRNIDEAIKQVESSGGKIVVPKTLIPGVGWSAYFTDPDNNILGLWQQDQNAK